MIDSSICDLSGCLALVTGGAGFIGSHLVEALINEGARIRVLDNLSSGSESNLEKVRGRIDFIQGDIRDPDLLDTSFDGVDFVFHLAALRSVPKSMKHPSDYHEVNVAGTLNLLLQARAHKIRKFIFASSSSVYGDVDCFPQSEKEINSPLSPYALTKLMGEQYCRLFFQAYSVKTVSLRYFNVFGPRQSLDDEYSVVIPRFIHSALREEAIPIYGTGTQSRDFTFVDNVVRANIMTCLSPHGSGEVFNVACGESHTVNELARHIKGLLGSKSPLTYLAPRSGDVFKTHAEISKIRETMGFVPKVGFEEGLRRTISWHREQYR